jgi:hypothetical protein
MIQNKNQDHSTYFFFAEMRQFYPDLLKMNQETEPYIQKYLFHFSLLIQNSIADPHSFDPDPGF